MYYNFIISSLIDGHLGSFHFLVLRIISFSDHSLTYLCILFITLIPAILQ